MDCIEDIFTLLYFHLNSANFERKTENILGVTKCLSYYIPSKGHLCVNHHGDDYYGLSAGFDGVAIYKQ